MTRYIYLDDLVPFVPYTVGCNIQSTDTSLYDKQSVPSAFDAILHVVDFAE